MAKVKVEPLVEGLIDYKGINSLLNSMTLTALYTSIQNNPVILMLDSTTGLQIDRFAIPKINITLPMPILYNTSAMVGYNKYLRKTKTTAKLIPDRIIYSTPTKDDEDDAILELHIPQNNEHFEEAIKNYRILFKADFSECLFNDIFNCQLVWNAVSNKDIHELILGSPVFIKDEDGFAFYISKALFGKCKKMLRLSWSRVFEDEDSTLVLFRQEEELCDIYHLVRYLNMRM